VEYERMAGEAVENGINLVSQVSKKKKKIQTVIIYHTEISHTQYCETRSSYFENIED